MRIARNRGASGCDVRDNSCVTLRQLARAGRRRSRERLAARGRAARRVLQESSRMGQEPCIGLAHALRASHDDVEQLELLQEGR